MKDSLLFVLLSILFLNSSAQLNWKLTKNKDDIKVYMAPNENSKFKNIRVQCKLNGNIAKLQRILRDVSNHTEWVYKAKNASMLKQATPDDFIYYSETSMPWPLSNRDGVYHLIMNVDTLHHSLSVVALSEPNTIPKKVGLIRIPHSKAVWSVFEDNNQLSIDYTFEVDPGGSIPAWMANMFADKGPYESFHNLEVLLTK